MKYNFWERWKNKTDMELDAIRSLKTGKKIILENIPKSEIIAIYIKGSFVRREMKMDSDVDMVPIVSENKYQDSVFDVNSPEINPVIVVPLSLWEFEHNKLWTKSDLKPDLRAKPDRLLKKIKECKLIYGKPLNPKKYPIRDDKTAVEDEIKLIMKGYIPFYERGRIEFNPLLKEVFWLVELEQNVLGKKVNHSFEGISNSVYDKNHIIHDANNLRKNPSKNKEKKFILKLRKYLEKINRF